MTSIKRKARPETVNIYNDLKKMDRKENLKQFSRIMTNAFRIMLLIIAIVCGILLINGVEDSEHLDTLILMFVCLIGFGLKYED